MAKFCSLFSSSSGNSTYIASGKTGILIDAGVSTKRLMEALAGRNIDPSELGGIFITHEHSDHIKGLRILASKFGIPVWATAGTMAALEDCGAINGKFPCEVIGDEGVCVGDLLVKRFRTPHDSAESCGYIIEFPSGDKAAVATDIGAITDAVRQAITGCGLVMLESNHDVGMLQNGPYPYMLKRRILSDVGHLSNVACAEMATELIKSGTTRLFLGHLSEENNMPDLAYQTNVSAISCALGAVNGRDYLLEVNEKVNSRGIVRF